MTTAFAAIRGSSRAILRRHVSVRADVSTGSRPATPNWLAASPVLDARRRDENRRRASLGPNAYVFGSPAGGFGANFKTAWESLLLIANGHETKRAKPGARVDRTKLRQIDLHWHDLRHEGACRLLAEGGHPHDPTDARACRHQADAAVPD